jgi:hypothetical protein
MPRRSANPRVSFPSHLVRSVRYAVVAGLAAAFMLAGVSSASADVFSPASWLVSSNVRVGSTDCFVTYGPVKDPNPPATGFRLIAGAQVNCQTRHAQIGVTVRQYVYKSIWYQVGNGIGTVYTNSAGFGSRILEMNVGCQHSAFPDGYWETGAYVTIDGHGYGWYYSPYSQVGGNC